MADLPGLRMEPISGARDSIAHHGPAWFLAARLDPWSALVPLVRSLVVICSLRQAPPKIEDRIPAQGRVQGTGHHSALAIKFRAFHLMTRTKPLVPRVFNSPRKRSLSATPEVEDW